MEQIINKALYRTTQYLTYPGNVCRAALLFVAFMLCLHPAKGQAQERGIVLESSKTLINASNEELVDMIVKIANKGDEQIDGTLKIHLPGVLDLASKNNIPINLTSGDSTFLPVKVFLSRKATAGKTHALQLSLHDQADKVVAEKEIEIRVNVKKSVSLYNLVSDVILESSNDSITVPVRISNKGNSMQEVNIIAQFPVREEESQQTIQLNIPAYTDTLIRFSRMITREMYLSGGSRISIVGMYLNGEVFGMSYTTVQSARNIRNYNTDHVPYRYDMNNSLSVSMQNIGNTNESYLVSGRGALGLPQGTLSYNLDATSWKNSTYSPAMLRNTWIKMESRNIALTAGNIGRNMEINLNGRGAAVAFTDTARSNFYEGGYINSNSNLLGNAYGFYPTGEAAWGTFRHRTRSWELESSAVYDANPLLNTRNTILSNALTWKKIKNIRISTQLNVSNQKAFRLAEEARAGFAISLSADGQLNKLNFSSSNFRSSAYYPGVRKGALMLSERATWMGEKSTIWGTFNYYDYQPAQINTVISPQYGYLNSEFGVSRKVFKDLDISIAAGYTTERNNSYQLGGSNENISLRAWNVTSAFNYAITPKQYLALNVETGLFQTSLTPENEFHLRANTSYRYGLFNLNATLQLGNFYVNEAVNNYLQNESANRLVNITPSLQHSFFKNHTRVMAGISYQNSSINGSNALLTGRIDQDILPATTFFATLNHSRVRYDNGDFRYNMIELGITQKLPSMKLGSKDHTLSMMLFRDYNQNGIYDKGDSLARRQTVYINETIFITSDNGTVTYKNLPEGEYSILLPGLNGWHAPEQKVYMNKKTNLSIPLHRTGTIKGRISYHFNEFSYDVLKNPAGITIIATDDQNRSYITRTNVDGTYVFYIPAGSYNLTIDQKSLPEEVEPAFSAIPAVVEPEAIKTIELKLNIKGRRIKTKRFTSPSIKE